MFFWVFILRIFCWRHFYVLKITSCHQQWNARAQNITIQNRKKMKHQSNRFVFLLFFFRFSIVIRFYIIFFRAVSCCYLLILFLIIKQWRQQWKALHFYLVCRHTICLHQKLNVKAFWNDEENKDASSKIMRRKKQFVLKQNHCTFNIVMNDFFHF